MLTVVVVAIAACCSDFGKRRDYEARRQDEIAATERTTEQKSPCIVHEGGSRWLFITTKCQVVV